MDLTIVIVSFKSGDILHRCIKSIDNKYKILVIENSLDNGLKTKLEKKYLNVKCILPNENLGYGGGNNLGIKVSQTNYVLVLNPDTILNKNTIPNLLKEAEIIKDFAIIGPRIVEDNGKKKNENNKTYELASYLKGFAILFNKKKLDKIGYFDESFFLYFEEIDLCKRIIDNGEKIYVINSSSIKHIGGQSHENKFNFEMELSRNWHWMWSTCYYFKKNYGLFFAIKKVYKNFVTSIFKIIFYSLIFNLQKKQIYLQRLSGIINGIFGKKSWYRPKI
tara:strand:- start:946 stop:1776 length:831 start_codon:yes stop_codon:yes gene_type:complete